MSYEGYTQYLCENGHASIKDAYDDYFNEEFFKCPCCNGKQAWSNMVDVTNGSFDVDEHGNEIRIDGYVELEVKIPAPVCTCAACGNAHTTGPTIYKMPGCSKSLDGVCHFEADTDRDGVACVVLKDGIMDHNFPRVNWHPGRGVCIYCARLK